MFTFVAIVTPYIDWYFYIRILFSRRHYMHVIVNYFQSISNFIKIEYTKFKTPLKCMYSVISILFKIRIRVSIFYIHRYSDEKILYIIFCFYFYNRSILLVPVLYIYNSVFYQKQFVLISSMRTIILRYKNKTLYIQDIEFYTVI